MRFPQVTYISEKEVPQRNQQRRVWLSIYEKTPIGQSATLEFDTPEEAQKARQNAVSVLCQQKRNGKFQTFTIIKVGKTIYITNQTT